MNTQETTITFKMQFSDEDATPEVRRKAVRAAIGAALDSVRREAVNLEEELRVRVRVGDFALTEFVDAPADRIFK